MGIEVPTDLEQIFMTNLSGKNLPYFYFFSVTGKTEKSEVFSTYSSFERNTFNLVLSEYMLQRCRQSFPA